MSVEENIRVFEANLAAINAREFDKAKENFAEDLVFYAPDSPEPLKGFAAVRQRTEALIGAFPDLRAEKVRAFGQGDRVCAELLVTGTHKGPLPGPGGQTIPATNRPVRLALVNVMTFHGGRVTEVRQYYDRLGMMAQLGLAPQSVP